MKLLLCVLMTSATLALAARDAGAVPRYAARVGQDCMLCHEAPSGGGLRSAYAAQFIVPTEMTMKQVEAPDLEIAAGVRLGGDLRTLVADGDDDRSILVLMQADLYLGAELGGGTSVMLETTRSGVGTAYGMVRTEGGRFHVRAGRFEPDHGWRFADHRLASRRYLTAPDGAVDPGRLLDDGVEVGGEVGPFRLRASVHSGAGGHGGSRALRCETRRSVGPLNLVAGASTLRDVRTAGTYGAVGLFGAIATGSWSWLFQLDHTEAPGEDGRIVTHEWSALVRRGLELRVTYDHQDPDRDRLNGARERWSAGVEAFVTPALRLTGRGVRETSEAGDRVAGGEVNRFESVIHFLF